jgi:surfeit locus 1 family protein
MTDRVRLLVLPTLAMLVTVAILMALGTWQVQRLAWKSGMIATVESRAKAAPVAFPQTDAWGSIDLDAVDYLPVRLVGRFRHSEEVHVYWPLTEPKGAIGGAGYFVFTPLEQADGSLVFVNRGFVPEARKDPATRADGQIAGDVTIEGLIRRPEAANGFTPPEDLARNRFYQRDPNLFATARGLDSAKVAPVFVDAAASATPAGGLPQAGETLMVFRNNHLQYAGTWYGLALCCLGVYAVFVRARLKRHGEIAPPGAI